MLPASRRAPARLFRLLLWAFLVPAALLHAPPLAAKSLALEGSTRRVSDAAVPGAPQAPYISRRSLRPDELAERRTVQVALSMRDFDGLQARLGAGEVISQAEIDSRYWPLQSDYQAVEDWLVSQGLTIETTETTRLSVYASGTVQQLAAVFQTHFARVKSDGDEFTSALEAPTVPDAIAARMVGINGLQPHLRPHRHSRALRRLDATELPSPASLNSNGLPYYPSDLSGAYNANGLSGSGQKVAIVIDTFPAASDLTTFWQTTRITAPTVEEVQVISGTLPSPSGEESLDVEWSGAMSAGATVRVYAALSLSFTNLDPAYARIYADLPTNAGLKQVSLSYGLGELYASTSQMRTDSQYFATLASAGVSIFVAAGDGGSNPSSSGHSNTGDLQVETPSSDPNVTAVGGTSLSVSTSKTYGSETAWSLTGGGASAVFSRPSWQTGTGVASGSARLVPDVAAIADENTGVLVVLNGEYWQYGGTSVSAPVWAGFSALLNKKRTDNGLGSIGLLGKLVYPLLGTSNFHDITSGNNGGYSATTGFDECTGLGTPNVGILAATVSATAPSITSATALSGTVGTALSYQVSASGSPTQYGFAWSAPCQGPAGFNASTGVFTLTPQAAGTYSFIVYATNAVGTTSKTVTLTIASAVTVPSFTSGTVMAATVGVSASYQSIATNQPISYGFQWNGPGCPGPASFNTSTGLLTIVPAVVGSYSFTVTTYNASGSAATTVTLTVASPAGSAPVLSSASSVSAALGVAATYQVVASGSPTAYGFVWNGAGCPGPATYDVTTGLLTITPAQSGTYSFTVSAANASGTGSETVTLLVGGNAPSLTGASALSDTTGTPCTYQVVASGSPTAFGFVWDGAGCPGPATYDVTTGLLTITPSQAGTYAFTVSAANAYGTGSLLVSFTVSAAAPSAANAQPTTSAGFEAWRALYFTTAELADPSISGPDGIASADGLTNLFKYALGLEPMAAASAGLPVESGGPDYSIYMYIRPVDRDDVVYNVEASTDGVSWVSEGPGRVTPDGVDGYQVNTVEIDGEELPLQFRLQVSFGE